jgi:glycosyltransferase involved in cell wall biosynthesis
MGRVAFEYTERLRRHGHDAQVFTLAPAVADDPPHVHRLAPAVRVGNAGLAPAIAARTADFDVRHLHYPFFGGAEFLAAARPSSPLVVTYHMDATADGWKGRVFDAHAQVLLPRILRRASRILVSSSDYAAHSALSRLTDRREQIEVHPFGVDLERFKPAHDDRDRSTLGMGRDDLVALFVGGLDAAHAFKGLPVLLRALALPASAPWHLVVVGDGDRRASFEATAAELGLRSRTHFAGDVPEDALPSFYRAADVHVLPSTAKAEAFGLVALEAAASGIPTVATNLPGVRSVVCDGETGVIVPPADDHALARALQRLERDPAWRRALGVSARIRAEQEFDWPPLITRLIATYESVSGARLTSDPAR